MASVILREVLADRERLGITQFLEAAGIERSVAGVRTCFGTEEAGAPPLSPSLLIIPQRAGGGAGPLPPSVPLARGNYCCAAVSEAQEIPRTLRLFSKKTGATVFASRFDAWLLHSRLIGLLAEKGDRRVVLHGVLIEICGIGVLITGESGTGKTACGLELASSGAGWVADDVVVLEARGDALYGRGHDRTKGLIALRGLGICRAERLLGSGALRGSTRVDMIVRLQRCFKGGDIAGGGVQSGIQKIVGVTLPCWRLAAGDEPRRTAGQVAAIVKGFTDSGSGGKVRAAGGKEICKSRWG